MCEIEGNRDAGNAVRREPLVRQPEVRPEHERARLELAIDLVDANRELGAFDLQIELAELQVQELVVGHRRDGVWTDFPHCGAGQGGPLNQRGAPSTIEAAACEKTSWYFGNCWVPARQISL